MVERWVAMPGFEGLYEVSDLGAVRSLDRTIEHPQGRMRVRGRRLTQDTIRSGYLQVSLSKDGFQSRVQAHRAVLMAFVGPCPEGMEACHNNGVRTDNRLSNLRWDTRQGNALDRKRHGTEHNANKSACKYGHEFTPENTYYEITRVHRMCRTCARGRDQRRRQNA